MARLLGGHDALLHGDDLLVGALEGHLRKVDGVRRRVGVQQRRQVLLHADIGGHRRLVEVQPRGVIAGHHGQVQYVRCAVGGLHHDLRLAGSHRRDDRAGVERPVVDIYVLGEARHRRIGAGIARAAPQGNAVARKLGHVHRQRLAHLHRGGAILPDVEQLIIIRPSDHQRLGRQRRAQQQRQRQHEHQRAPEHTLHDSSPPSRPYDLPVSPVYPQGIPVSMTYSRSQKFHADREKPGGATLRRPA